MRITYQHTPECVVQQGTLARAWSDAFEAAGLRLERPEGSRRPRVELAPALPQGARGEREVFDAWLADDSPGPDEVCRRLATAAPPGLVPLAAIEIGERLPSLGASVRSAGFRVDFAPGAVDANSLAARVGALLASATLEVDEVRGERVRRIDLRAQIRELKVVRDEQRAVRLEMRLVAEHERVGRPSTVLVALGCGDSPHTLVRTDVEVEVPRVAIRAWRERGRFA